MANDLIVRVLGETSQFEKSLKTATRTTTAFDRTLKKSAITAEQSAQTQIAASLKKDARLREEIALYRQIASVAAKGSREQVVAANLAERAERQLGRSMGATSTEARALAGNTKRFERDLSSATRGALSGSGIFRGLGRSIVFASGGFLAFGGAAAFLRKSIDAAKEAQVVEAQLGQQFQSTGRDASEFQGRIDKASNALAASSGFNNDELKAALTTILRTQPNVAKALRDTATAADLARARHIGLAQAALVVAEVEGHNTTLLRRQGIQVAKNATVEEALAVLRAKVAGQAAAGATEQERFGAILHTTEEIIGQGILPTLNEYLQRGGVWLEQMNQSGKLQKNVADGAHSIETAVSAASTAIHDIDDVTGSFKNTLELLLALKVGSIVSGWIGSFSKLSTEEGRASKEAQALQTRLKLLPAAITVAVVVEVVIHRKQVDDAVKSVQQKIAEAQQHSKPVQLLAKGESEIANAPGIKNVLGLFGVHNVTPESLLEPLAKIKTGIDKVSSAADAMGDKVALAGAKAAHGLALAAADAASATDAISRGLNITAGQRNTFFDNAIARILLRGGLGDIQTQIGALQRADALIQARIKATKDVTRRQNLEDQLLQNQAQIAQLRESAANDAKQASDDARQKFIDSLGEATAQAQFRVQVAQASKSVADDIPALLRLNAAIEAQIRAEGKTADLQTQLFENRQAIAAARAQQITGRQFVALGLTSTGEQRIPGVQALRKALGNVQDEVIGSSLDTKKTKSLLDSIRKVLSGGLGSVGEEVRAKIQQILGDLDKQLDKSTQKNLTKWRHISTQALLAGVPDLSPQQRRALTARLSTLGPGGTVPPRTSAAFNGRPVVVEHTTYLDGKPIARSTTKYQQKNDRRRAASRRGQYAGRN